MRVIAGSARGVPLAAPEGTSTRPTSGRLRENFFNMLSPVISGAVFLDLFSGSGAMGIEALSRGARRAVLVEQSRQAAVVIKANLAKTKLADSAELLIMTAERAVKQFSLEKRKYDIIFLDPPYESSLLNETMRLLADANILTGGGIIAAELPAGNDAPEYKPLEVSRVKTYGGKKFVIWADGK